MKKSILVALIGISAVLMTSCENEPSDPIPASFPKKHLIEEFTGQGCGYCPYGMDCIHEFIGNDTNWILILHHDGYSADHFTVSGSTTITKALGVTGAPQMAINRAKTNFTDEYGKSKNTIVFHPDYLKTTPASQFSETTYASVRIDNQYDAASRKLSIKVSGEIATPDAPELYLTVLIKESGMIDTQADYVNTFNGWKEFRHANAVRAFLTAPKGDELTVRKQRYSQNYTITLNEKWVPENCMVVAFLSENFRPVVQAEQRPVVAGTSGGADIRHGGVTPVAVPDYYPEPNATDGPSVYSHNEADTLTTSLGWIANSGSTRLWGIMAYDAEGNIKISRTRCMPFTYLYLFTAPTAATIPTGTYELNLSEEAGTALAGYCDIEHQTIGGCTLYYTSKSYFDEGYLDPKAQWMIADGTLTITETGWELIGHSLNGSDIHLISNEPIQYSSSQAPAKLKRL